MAKLATVLCVFAAAAVATATASLVNERVDRDINLQSNIARVMTQLTIRNDGSSAAKSFDVVFAPDEAAHLSDFKAEAEQKDLSVSAPEKTDKGTKFTVSFLNPLKGGDSTKLSLLAAFTHVMTPFPTHISQFDNQLVMFEGNVHFYSPYPSEASRTSVVLGSNKVESYFPESGTLKGATVAFDGGKCGKYASSPLRVHFENNYPFMTLTSVTKEVEVSHWGHVSFEEHVDLLHTGAKLSGGFARIDYQRNPAGSPSHFRQIVARLPSDAHTMYYRDVIGNISTSRARVETPEGQDAYTHLELYPRYLMFGGWKTRFYFGYVSALGQFLGLASDGTYSLNVPFGTTILGAVVDSLTTKVILPEGATDIQVSGVSGLTEERSIRKTYLDTTGRPVVVLSKANVVGDNDAILTITYRFPANAIYREVVLLVGAFFCFFVAMIFCGRFRMSIGSKGAQSSTLKDDALDLLSALHLVDRTVRGFVDHPAEEARATKSVGEKFSKLERQMDKFSHECLTKTKALAACASRLVSAASAAAHSSGAAAKGKKSPHEMLDEALKEYQAKFVELDHDLTSKL